MEPGIRGFCSFYPFGAIRSFLPHATAQRRNVNSGKRKAYRAPCGTGHHSAQCTAGQSYCALRVTPKTHGLHKTYATGLQTPSRFDFGHALELLKNRKRVCREGWNGKGHWIELQTPDENSKMTLPYLFLNYPTNAINTPGARVPWVTSQTDVLADDWQEAA
ncbi:MAG: DUF2829 domain-containing protein [Proteobacteria bacterium]|nr:DUF2829 domain-containing protein [Pseudomonadota bacterium]